VLSIELFIDIILPAVLCHWGRLGLLKMSSKYIYRG